MKTKAVFFSRFFRDLLRRKFFVIKSPGWTDNQLVQAGRGTILSGGCCCCFFFFFLLHCCLAKKFKIKS